VSIRPSWRPRTRSTGSAIWLATFDCMAQPRFQYTDLRTGKDPSTSWKQDGRASVKNQVNQ
jgi:hypothetical protein